MYKKKFVLKLLSRKEKKMKQKNFYKTVLTLAFLFLFISSSFNLPSYAQYNEQAKYYPLAVGNVWYAKKYLYLMYYCYDSVNVRREIIKDSIMNGKRYFFFSNSYLIRYDSATSNLLEFDPPGCSIYSYDKIIDSLASRKNDTVYCSYSGYFTRRCTDTSFNDMFGFTNVKTKSFHYSGLVESNATYAMNFGVIKSGGYDQWGNGEWTHLRGCRINGIVYGDTVLSFVKQISSTVPEKYILHQNYPNPFNPITTIKFDIPNSSFVKMSVYNSLGQEVTTLVNEKLSAGSFETSWDGANYPSGVYFYRLSTDAFVSIKKMLFIK